MLDMIFVSSMMNNETSFDSCLWIAKGTSIEISAEEP